MRMGVKQGVSAVSSSEKTDITEDEAALYDRQIRLWGLDAQKRLRNSKILIIGLGGLGAEVAKNLALAGVKSISLFDDKKVGPNDRSSQFLVSEATEGSNRSESSCPKVHSLNPNVEVLSEVGPISEKDDSYFAQFGVICATDCSADVLHRLDAICRQNETKFFCGDTWGFYGYCFADLGKYTYLKPPTKSSEEVVVEENVEEPVPKKQRSDEFQIVKFPSLERALSFKSGKAGMGLPKKMSKIFFLVHILLKFREDHQRLPSPEHHDEDLQSLKELRQSVMQKLGFEESKVSDNDLSVVFGEISPVCAIVGGVLAQEIIKAISAAEAPLQNFFLFDGDTSLGVIESIG